MAMAITLREYLDRAGIEYELVPHPYTYNSMETAEEARVPGDKLAKGVVLEDDDGYLMAVLPATRRLGLDLLEEHLQRRLSFATEPELGELFDDCDIGAVPPLGKAYGCESVLDQSLLECSDVYFEAGDHTGLVHLRGEDFRRLMTSIPSGNISRHI